LKEGSQEAIPEITAIEKALSPRWGKKAFFAGKHRGFQCVRDVHSHLRRTNGTIKRGKKGNVERGKRPPCKRGALRRHIDYEFKNCTVIGWIDNQREPMETGKVVGAGVPVW